MVDTDFGGRAPLRDVLPLTSFFGCRTLRFLKGADFDSVKLLCTVDKD